MKYNQNDPGLLIRHQANTDNVTDTHQARISGTPRVGLLKIEFVFLSECVIQKELLPSK